MNNQPGTLTWLARLLASALAWTFLMVSSAVLFPVALVVWLVTLPFDRNLVVQHLFTSAWGAMYIYVHPGWKLRIDGRSKLPWRERAIIVVNHLSLIDALVMFALYRPYKPLSKASVQWIPFIGWNLMMNRYVRLARGDRKSLARMGSACRYWLRREMPVLIYPEGQRSADGEIKQFNNGAFTLALEENCPIYPIVLTGTADALPKHSGLIGLQARMWARVLDPIYPAIDDSEDLPTRSRIRVAALREQVRELMIRELARLRVEQANLTSEPAEAYSADLSGRMQG